MYLGNVMEIYFRSKEESNLSQRQEFLELDGAERILRHLHLQRAAERLPLKNIRLSHQQCFEISKDRPMQEWNDEIMEFVGLASQYGVRMILVGGGSVNFHGYQRHSANVDFWIDTSTENFEKLIKVFQLMGYELEQFPDAVLDRKQNISIKFSPVDLRLELITRFSLDKSFDNAYSESEVVVVETEHPLAKWNVLSYNDLIASKLKSQRPKDLLDIQELERIRKNKQ